MTPTHQLLLKNTGHSAVKFTTSIKIDTVWTIYCRCEIKSDIIINRILLRNTGYEKHYEGIPINLT